MVHNCGCGVGFSVERQYIANLPVVNEDFYDVDSVIQVHDSKIGWATALRQLIALLYVGQVPKWDLSKVRPKGVPLKTFGGRACLTGDTIVYRRDGKKSRGHSEITLKQLFEMKHSQGFWEHKPNHFKDTKLRSLDENKGTFFKNRLIDIIDNGDNPVYELVTKNGYRIKATDNHRFMNEFGDYQELGDFKVGDPIAVNGIDRRVAGKCVDCGVDVYKTSIRCRKCNLSSDEVVLMFDEIISIEYSGVERVYDLVMQGPNHNFIANGFVSHNSGPEPLNKLLVYTVNLFKKAAGRKLNSLECHDLVCEIASSVVVGGVRRCLKHDTQVKMDDGSWRQISKIVVGDEVKMPDGSSALVTNVFDNGLDEVVKIYLQDGTFFECSSNHRWYVFNHQDGVFEWVEAKDISKGDYSMVSPS